MKKTLFLLCLGLMIGLSTYGQTVTTVSAPSTGSVRVAQTGYYRNFSASSLWYEADSLRKVVKIWRQTELTSPIVSLPPAFYRDATGTTYTTVAQVATYLSSIGIGNNPAGGGGGSGGGDASAANQVTGNGILTQINSKTPALGQAAMAASQPVVIANNQTALPVTGAFYQTTQPISAAALPLPTGAATAANQSTIITSVQSIDTKTPTVGQKASAGSSPVVISSDQSAIPITATTLPLATGASTAANQATQITAEQAIVTNTTHQQALYTASSVSLTTTPTALPTAASVTVEIKNNIVGAVDILVVKNGGAVETVPAGAVVRFDGITNANQLSVYSSAGTPTIFYRLYTQLMQ